MAAPWVPVKYKGETFAVQPGQHTWTRGQGWSSRRRVKGDPQSVWGDVVAMQQFCDKIDVSFDDDGMYGDAVGQYAGLTEGTPDETARGEQIWDVEYNESEIPIWDGPYAAELESAFPGAIAIVRKSYDDWVKDSGGEHVGLFTPSFWLTAFRNAPAGVQDAAQELFNRLVSGVTHIRFFQSVLSYSSSVGRSFTTKKPIPGRPTIYTTTAALASALPIPGDVLFELPEGRWLEHPPRVRRIVNERTEFSQRWEHWHEIDTVVAYPQ